jgi:hypothetical protein
VEEYAITYENLVLSTYSIEHILDLHLYEQINDHGMLHLIAIIPEEHAEEYVYTTEPMQSVTLGYRKEDQTTETLYRGLVTDIQINCSGNVYYMDLTVKGKTYAMDIIKRYRSFQNTAMTTHELIREVLSGYQDSDCILQIPNEPIGRLIVQYHETDWEFLVRVVSHYGAVLVPDLVSERLAFYVGIPEQGDEFTITPYHYHVSKSMDEYLAIRENQWADVKEMDFMVFQALDVQIFRVGNFINLYGKRLVIQAVQRELTDGILKNTYTMKRKEGLKGLEIHNYELVGASVIGQVIEISRDKVKVQLEMDEQGRAAYWFPYSTMSASPDGSGWYCMPEKGDRVRVYFPTNQESDAYAVSAVSGHQPQPGDAEDPMGNPAVKYLKTKADQVIQFAEEGIIINSGSGQATVFLGNSGDLSVYGTTNVNVTAKNTLSLVSKGQLLIGAKDTVSIKRGEGTSITLDQDGNINLKGKKIYSN